MDKSTHHTNSQARVIAFYLPQFHPIPENDQWWGKGFTEWTNVAKAKPLFHGHYQPRIPADLGFYDLRLPEVREQQAQMAREAGIEGFCYWHYWFGNGKQLLERPFNEVLASGKPDFPFCLGWANETWTNKSWEEGTRQMKLSTLMQQEYSPSDYERHFYAVLPAFKDKRYITVDGKPLFVVFRPLEIPDPDVFIGMWQRLAKENGLQGIHFVGIKQNYDTAKKTISGTLLHKDSGAQTEYERVLHAGFDAVNARGNDRAEAYARHPIDLIRRYIAIRLFRRFTVSRIPQQEANKWLFVPEDKQENIYPTLLPNWDRSARSGKKARIYTGSTPALFREQLTEALALVKDKQPEHRILFLQSWNEWAEGNYVEPDLRYGHGFLDALRETLLSE